MNSADKILYAGIDVGSTTTKFVLVDPETEEILFSNYERHHADQAASVRKALLMVSEKVPGLSFKLALTGSGAKTLAERLQVPYIQEVVANSIALKKRCPSVRTAIELGGQDAKMIFFKTDEKGELAVADMRMNGSCAGGTGAFIDEIASLLKIPIEEFNSCASQGTTVFDISGRCGVYAKTDIQPLLNQGVSRQDLALSSMHAIAKQTIGGLAQGLDIKRPIAFEGGPLTFNPRLVQVFAERLELEDEDILYPDQPELMVAYGAALSAVTMFAEEKELFSTEQLIRRLDETKDKVHPEDERLGRPYFADYKEYLRFKNRTALKEPKHPYFAPGSTVKAYLGIDSGSTTTKFVLIDENEDVIDSFYASNEGDPLAVAKTALIELREKYKREKINLDIIASASTGYGEMLFNKAFNTECHLVETVAHARATGKYVKDASFILDIGGQDMKAIWIEQGIITNIVVNEACSSGCGSFLQSFASSLDIPVKDIAEKSFASKNPAVLGSRCTVFMNSSIITEQRNGKLPEDIMAGLCRSIIENVFTKVIRISNLTSLGNKIVVQGGTFQNDAVLCAMEQYIGREVIRAPYPGIMGAIGAALAAKEKAAEEGFVKSFIGLDAMESFYYTQEANVPCPFCGNHCKRSIIRFSNGNSWVTNNRCENGEILGDVKDAAVREQLKEKNKKKEAAANLFKDREKLLFADYAGTPLCEDRGVTIGIPRVLYFWETMPFWSTFFKKLGFNVVMSDKSSRAMYEKGLYAVASDTVCFPAKLVHGHIRNLVEKKVDRIFMPSVTVIPSENTEKTSISMCAVVKGYPIVMRNSDNPTKQWGIPFDAPLFHWYTNEDRQGQLTKYMQDTFGIPMDLTIEAILYADQAQKSFQDKLKLLGTQVIDRVTKEGKYAVVLASRPYQNDFLVNHDLPEMFNSLGISVLTADSVPGTSLVDMSNSRVDVVNNFHARMLSTAILAAESDHLEYVQLVSFGCGHDAYLSDEIQRMMKEISGKAPLILKVDESDIQGPLRIRVRSFIETINMKRKAGNEPDIRALADPYPVKLTKKDAKEKIVLVPNTSHAFSRIMAAAMARQGLHAIPLPVGREEAIKLGKQYVHNDICFPAQIVIGEALAAVKSGEYDPHNVAIAMGKYIGDCRLTHYGTLLRKALDDAGFSYVPILTNDDVDYHNMHPGFRMNLNSAMSLAYALPMIDILEELLRKIRPYEKVKGSADRAFEEAMDYVVYGLEKGGINGAKKGFKKAISRMKAIGYDRSRPRPTVLIVGEYLLNFHPGANHDIEAYLEKNGFEIIEARMTDVIRKTYFYQKSQDQEYKVHRPLAYKANMAISDSFFELAHNAADKIAKAHPLYQPAVRMPELVKASDEIIHHTFDAGEGVLIPGEILHHAAHGCKAFVILQPFGCLPNHIVGRGIAKRLKEMYPDVQILPLDYDPDVSFANVENRLQMLVMNARQQAGQEE